MWMLDPALRRPASSSLISHRVNCSPILCLLDCIFEPALPLPDFIAVLHQDYVPHVLVVIADGGAPANDAGDERHRSRDRDSAAAGLLDDDLWLERRTAAGIFGSRSDRRHRYLDFDEPTSSGRRARWRRRRSYSLHDRGRNT